jgi:hypothetical protein
MDILSHAGKGLLQAAACVPETATNLFGIEKYDGKCEFFGGQPPLPVRHSAQIGQPSLVSWP